MCSVNRGEENNTEGQSPGYSLPHHLGRQVGFGTEEVLAHPIGQETPR